MRYFTMTSSIGHIVIEAKDNNRANAVLQKMVAVMGIRTGASGICKQDEVNLVWILTSNALYGNMVYARYDAMKVRFAVETFDEFKVSKYFHDAVFKLHVGSR